MLEEEVVVVAAGAVVAVGEQRGCQTTLRRRGRARHVLISRHGTFQLSSRLQRVCFISHHFISDHHESTVKQQHVSGFKPTADLSLIYFSSANVYL